MGRQPPPAAGAFEEETVVEDQPLGPGIGIVGEDIDDPIGVSGDALGRVRWIIDAIHERVLPLPDHVVTQNYTNGELQRITRQGV